MDVIMNYIVLSQYEANLHIMLIGECTKEVVSF